MKRLLTLLLTLATMASCFHDVQQDVGGAVIPTEGLNETGLQFVRMLQKRPTWQTEWVEMTEHGSPLPNEMIVLGSVGSPQNTSATRNAETAPSTFCFVPVVDGRKIVRMIVAPVLQSDGKQILGLPKIFDEEGIDKNTIAHSVVEFGIVNAWRDKGYEFDVQLTPLEPMPQTRSVSSANYYTFRVSYVTRDPGELTREEIDTRGSQIILGFLPSPYPGVKYYATVCVRPYVFGTRIELLDPTRGSNLYYLSRYTRELEDALKILMYTKHRVLIDCWVIPEFIWDNWQNNYENAGTSGGAGSGSQAKVTGPGLGGNINSDFGQQKPTKADVDCSGMGEHKNRISQLNFVVSNLQGAEYASADPTQGVRMFPGYQDFFDWVMRYGRIEYSLSIIKPDWASDIEELNVNDGYLGHPQGVVRGNANTVNIREDPNIAASIHYHPASGNPTPSALDLVHTVYMAVQYPSYQGAYILAANGEKYCVAVTMTPAQRQALQAKISDFEAFKNSVVDSSNGFKMGSPSRDYYYNAMSQFSNLDESDRICHTLSYIADKNGWGVTVMRNQSGRGSFVSKHVIKSGNYYVPAECL